MTDERQVKLVSYKLRGGAAVWWERLQMDKRRQGRTPIRSWRRMKQLLMSRFLPPDYEQFIFQSLQNCVQGNKSVTDYTEEWSRLSIRNNLNESEAQQVSRYLGGLKSSIREKIGLQVVWTVDEAHNMALKAELMEKTPTRFSPYRNSGDPAYKGKFTANDGQNPPKTANDQTLRGAASTSNQSGGRTVTMAREAPRAPSAYVKPGGFKCYRCGQPGHRSNECLARRPVNLVDAGMEDEDQYVEEESGMGELLEGAEVTE